MKTKRSGLGYAKRVYLLLLALAVFTCFFVILFVSRNKAYGNSASDKVCISIQIKEGDTLWAIASEYYTSECGSLKSYIKEIKKTNSLKSDSIHAGNYLLIPCYVPIQ